MIIVDDLVMTGGTLVQCAKVRIKAKDDVFLSVTQAYSD